MLPRVSCAPAARGSTSTRTSNQKVRIPSSFAIADKWEPVNARGSHTAPGVSRVNDWRGCYASAEPESTSFLQQIAAACLSTRYTRPHSPEEVRWRFGVSDRSRWRWLYAHWWRGRLFRGTFP